MLLQFFATNFHDKSLYREDFWEKIMTCRRNSFNVTTCSNFFFTTNIYLTCY